MVKDMSIVSYICRYLLYICLVHTMWIDNDTYDIYLSMSIHIVQDMSRYGPDSCLVHDMNQENLFILCAILNMNRHWDMNMNRHWDIHIKSVQIYVSLSIHILCTICRYILDTSRAHQPACTQDVRTGTAFLHMITLSCWLIAVLQRAMRDVSISHAT